MNAPRAARHGLATRKLSSSKGPLEHGSLQHIQEAIRLAGRSVSEPGEIQPKVGALIVRDGIILEKARRNERRNGWHAEETVFAKCQERGLVETLRGAIPSRRWIPARGGRSIGLARNGSRSICGIGGVAFGMVDPNRDERGSGLLLLQLAGIPVQLFPPPLQSQVVRMNRAFIEAYAGGEHRAILSRRPPEAA